MVIDIGGGSTEFLYLENEKLVGKSLDVGGVRLTEMFLPSEIPTVAEMSALTTYIRNQLDILPITNTQKIWVAVAGTPTTLASMYLGLKKYDENKIHNLKLHVDDIVRLQKKFFVPLVQRQSIIGLNPKRADIIIAASTILIEAMRKFGKDEIVVSTKGIRFGLMKELFG
jgi:exopolyphosphatase/guanosine-5'-triphosphate,3'-diphosphate pyrophosphatase